MPTKKNRQGGSTKAFSLQSAMQEQSKDGFGTPHNSKDYLFDNIRKNGGNKNGPKMRTSAGYDVNTRVAKLSDKGGRKPKRAATLKKP